MGCTRHLMPRSWPMIILPLLATLACALDAASDTCDNSSPREDRGSVMLQKNFKGIANMQLDVSESESLEETAAPSMHARSLGSQVSPVLSNLQTEASATLHAVHSQAAFQECRVCIPS